MEQIKKYVTEDGANINKDKAKALINAVEEDDYEKVKLCLSLGASPNLAKDSEAPISKAKNIEMIKLLVSYGSDITASIFNNVIHDIDALEYCLKAGLDPNFGNSMPFRRACRGSWESKDKMGESYLEAFDLLLKYASITDEKGRNMVIKWASEYGRIDILEHLKKKGYNSRFTRRDWEEAIAWLGHARKINPERSKETIDYLKSQM